MASAEFSTGPSGQCMQRPRIKLQTIGSPEAAAVAVRT